MPEPTQNPSDPTDADPSGNGGGQGQQGQPRDIFKLLNETFSQEEQNKIFAGRAKQARDSALSDLFKTLDVENAESLAALIKQARDADEAAKSELQEAQDRAANAEKAIADQKTAYETGIAELEKLLIDTEIKIAAGKTVTDPDGNVTRQAFKQDALEDVLVLINRKEISRKDGAVMGIESALDELAKGKKYLLDIEPEPQFKGSPVSNSARKPAFKEKKPNPSQGKHSRF